MQIQRLDYNQQIQITDEKTAYTIQNYSKILGTCSSFMSERLPRRDRRNVSDLVGFLGHHCIDAYVDFSENERVEVLALVKSPELYLTALSYLTTKINSLYPDRTLRIGHYVKGKGGKIKRFKNGMPKIKGRKFDVRSLPYKKFPDMHPKFYSALRLTPKSLFKGRAIDLVIVPEDFCEDPVKKRYHDRIWQEWLKSGSDVYYVF